MQKAQCRAAMRLSSCTVVGSLSYDIHAYYQLAECIDSHGIRNSDKLVSIGLWFEDDIEYGSTEA